MKTWLSLAVSGEAYVRAAVVWIHHIATTPALQRRFKVIVFLSSKQDARTAVLMRQFGARVVLVDVPPGATSMFWGLQRYMAHDELPKGAHWLAMDAHYLWNAQQDVAVPATIDAWLASGKRFTMYQWIGYHPRPFSGGWFGGTAQTTIASMADALRAWLAAKGLDYTKLKYGDDENFQLWLYNTVLHAEQTFLVTKMVPKFGHSERRFQNLAAERQAKLYNKARDFVADFTEDESEEGNLKPK